MTSHRTAELTYGPTGLLTTSLGGFRAAWRWLPAAVGAPDTRYGTWDVWDHRLHQHYGANIRLGKALRFSGSPPLALAVQSPSLSPPGAISKEQRFRLNTNISPLPLTRQSLDNLLLCVLQQPFTIRPVCLPFVLWKAHPCPSILPHLHLCLWRYSSWLPISL